MKTLVQFGAPKNILIDGKPHLGTDRLVPLLRNFRRHLQDLGVSFIHNFFMLKIYVYVRTIFLLAPVCSDLINNTSVRRFPSSSEQE